VADQKGFDFMSLVFFETCFQMIQGNALAPGDFVELNVESKALSKINPKMRELSKTVGQDLVAA
jgi:hypothetical protein